MRAAFGRITKTNIVASILLLLVVGMATVALAAQPNLIAAFFVKGKVGLKWQTIPGVTEYNILRKDAGGDFASIGTTDEDHYFDVNVVGGSTYQYKIGIIDETGAEVFSAPKTVVIPGAAGEFKPPTWNGVRVQGRKIMLNWDPVPNAIAYNVFRSTTEGGPYEVVGTAQGSRHADTQDIERGVTYYYRISALNAEFEETEQSEEESIKYGMSKEEMDAKLAEANKIELEDLNFTQVMAIQEAGQFGEMNQPVDVFLNSKGNIYITDGQNTRVHCFDPSGGYLFSFGEKLLGEVDAAGSPGKFKMPFTLFIDSKNQVYVTDIDRHDIQVFDEQGNFVKRITVDTGEGKAELRPNGIHVLDDGRIIITDTGNHRFLIIDGDGKVLFEKGGKGNEPGQFNFPDELTVTADNTICIVDVINCRIQEFDMEGNFIRMFGQVGQSAGTFARPKGIAADEKGRLWISDGMSNILQSFTMEGEVKAALGTDQDEWKFFSPRGMFFSNGRLYMVNRLRNQVLVFNVG